MGWRLECCKFQMKNGSPGSQLLWRFCHGLCSLRGQRQWGLQLSRQARLSCKNKKQTNKKKVWWHKTMRSYFLLVLHAHCGPVGLHSLEQLSDRAATFLNARHVPERQSMAKHALALIASNRSDSHFKLSHMTTPNLRGWRKCCSMRLTEEPGILGKRAPWHPR